MDLTSALKYPFTDKNWIVKTLILMACYLTIVLIPAGIGYQMAASRRNAQDPEASLPEWQGVGDRWMEGLRGLIVQFVYMFPGLLCIGGGCCLLGLFSYGGDRAVGFGLLLMVLAMVVGFVLMIAGGFMGMTSYLCMMADAGKISAGLNVQGVFAILKANIKHVFMFFVFAFIVGLIGGIINSITCGIGSIVVTPLSALIGACLYGQLFRLVMAKQFD